MTLTYRFVDRGGYDCMTDAFYIEDPSKPEFDRLVATVDLKDFGQSTANEENPEATIAALLITQELVDRFNYYQREVAL